MTLGWTSQPDGVPALIPCDVVSLAVSFGHVLEGSVSTLHGGVR